MKCCSFTFVTFRCKYVGIKCKQGVEISTLRAAVAAGTNLNKVITLLELKKKLGGIPETVVDRYSSVLCDLFHLMDRCKVSCTTKQRMGILWHFDKHFFSGIQTSRLRFFCAT
jgi:hypothetical protein